MTDYVVTKTRCTVVRAGRNAGQFDSDTIMIEGIPHVVFEWADDKPKYLASLEPQFYTPLTGWGTVTHLYEYPVVDPRPLS